jgi:hypothetical protein
MLGKNKKAVNKEWEAKGFNVTALFNVLGFVLSAMLAWVFGGLLRGGSMGGYELAVILSLGILSAFSTLLFGSMLVSQAGQWWSDQRRLAPALHTGASSRQGIAALAANTTSQSLSRPRLPQSEFARRWGQRKSLGYEQILQESRAKGAQQPYRLKCTDLNRLKLRLAEPYRRPTYIRQQWKYPII